MHIAINTTPLSGGHSARGVGLYTKELINALETHYSQHTYSYFTAPQRVSSEAHVVHYPFFDPFFLTMPWKKVPPLVVTVHDLIPIRFKTYFPRGIRGEMKWQVQKFLLQSNVSAVLTDSEASKQDIISYTGIKSNKIYTIPLAPRVGFSVVKDKKLLSSVRAKFKLKNSYFLYVGDINWNKNVHALIEAFSIFAKNNSNILVLVGKAFLDESIPESVSIRSKIRDLHLESKVICLGYVSDHELACLYSMAIAAVQPSIAEGFGFPVLEAMACNAPVLVSDYPSLQEISGPSISFNPMDTGTIVHALDTITSLSIEKRNLLIQKGNTWVKNYTWNKVAKETIAVYEKIINTHSSI